MRRDHDESIETAHCKRLSQRRFFRGRLRGAAMDIPPSLQDGIIPWLCRTLDNRLLRAVNP
jgi:hypothetical protein